MCLTFHIITLRKYLIKNIENFWEGTSILASESAVSPKMSTPALPMSLLFIAEFFSTVTFDKKNEWFNFEKKIKIFNFFLL